MAHHSSPPCKSSLDSSSNQRKTTSRCSSSITSNRPLPIRRWAGSNAGDDHVWRRIEGQQSSRASLFSNVVRSNVCSMRSTYHWSALAILAAVLAVPAVVSVQSPAPTSQGWPTVTGARGNMRYSPLAQITAQNVARLGGTWTSEKLNVAASSRAMPVVTDGLMIFTAPPFVYALDAKTGKTVWRYGTRPAGRGGAPASSLAREGVAVADGLVFVGMSDARVIALREKTGELVWNQY